MNLRGPDLGEMAVFDVGDARRASTAACRSRSTRCRAARPQVSAPVLEERGYLGPAFLIAHFLAATQADREAMARAGTPLSYAVHSELRLGDAGRRARGTVADARCGRDGLVVDRCDLDRAGEPLRGDERGLEPRASRGWAPTRPTCPALTFRRCLEMATIDGARALGLADVTGSLTPGKRADVILRPGDRPQPRAGRRRRVERRPVRDPGERRYGPRRRPHPEARWTADGA